MSSEEDDRKARKRIREAKRRGVVALDLSELAITRIPPELAQLKRFVWGSDQLRSVRQTEFLAIPVTAAAFA
jgi:hypothetical protein